MTMRLFQTLRGKKGPEGEGGGLGNVASLAFAGLFGFLALAVLARDTARIPGRFSGDQATYFGMTVSLAHGFNLRWEPEDFSRISNHYPYGPEGVILMTPDSGRTYYYSKPYLYSLVALPFYLVFGPGGFPLLNVLLLALLVRAMYRLLSRWGPAGPACVFAVLYFAMSATIPYLFWIAPELFNMFLLGMGTLLWFRCLEDEPARTGTSAFVRVLSAGALLGLAGVIRMPAFIFVVPGVLAFLLRKRYRAAASFALAVCLAAGVAVSGQYFLTGVTSPYHAVRYGMNAETGYPQIGDGLRTGLEAATWPQDGRLARVELDLNTLAANAFYFIAGRHTGMILYFTPALAALILFAARRRFELRRCLILGSVCCYSLFLLVYLPDNYFGGATFVGNRYLLPAYPLFLLLVSGPVPRWVIPAVFACGGLFAGSMILSPLPPHATPEAGRQFFARDWVHTQFPFESTAREIDGQQRFRKWGDEYVRFLDSDSSVQENQFSMPCPSSQQILIASKRPMQRIVFRAQPGAPGVRVQLKQAGQRVFYEPAGSGKELVPGYLSVKPKLPFRRHKILWLWRLPPAWAGFFGDSRLYWYDVTLAAERESAGSAADKRDVQLQYLGEGRELEEGFYRIEYSALKAPGACEPGGAFTAQVVVKNLSEHLWSSNAVAPVRAGYHWRDAQGNVELYEGARSPLAFPILPGKSRDLRVNVSAPEREGEFVLELDLVCEGVAWFSTRNGGRVARAPVSIGSRP